MGDASRTNVDALRQRLDGDVVGPGDAEWDAARQAWNLAVDQRPAAVVVAAGAPDVAATLVFAAESGLAVAPQSTGHGAAPLGALDDAILLRTSRLNGVEIDTERRRARVGAGAMWKDVVGPAGDAGLVALHGFSGSVGVAGYTLGGGVGWLSRSRGLACNSVTAMEVVLADGRTLEVDAENEPDLFWALRGGGGSGAVVTGFQLELFPLQEVFAGQLAWPMAQAPGVVEAYSSFTSDGLPEELASAIRLMRFPPIPELPPELRGQAFVIVMLAFAGDAQAGAELARPLRAVGAPAIDTLTTIPARDLAQLAGDPPGPVPGIGDTALLRELDPDAYLGVGGPDAQIGLTSIELRHLGGSVGRSDSGHGACDKLDAQFTFFAIGSPLDAASGEALQAELDSVKRQLAPSTTGLTLLSFAERQPGVAESFSAETTARLRDVSRRYDPDGLIRANHAVER
jgi:hypothetical protein